MVDVAVYGQAPHQIMWGNAFADGARKHGLKVISTASSDFSLTPEVAVFWSHRRLELINRQKARGKSYIVLELPYWGSREIDTVAMCSAGYNGLNGRADFRNANSSADRWKKHGPGLTEWQPPGQYALIMGQCAGDMSHAHADINKWYARMIAEWSAVMPVAFRDHPKGGRFRGDVPKLNGTLDEALKKAAIVVTFNSNSGVDALLAGVPVYAEDEGSMVYHAASHTVGQTLFPDRRQWAHDLAYCQWTQDEYRSGEAIAHLFEGM